MRQIFRGMSLRVVAASALCASLGVIVGTIIIISLMVDMCLTRVSEVVSQLDPVLQQQCARDPGEFHRHRGEGIEMRFYDADTLQPAVDGVPPVDAGLLERLRAGEAAPGRMIFFSAAGGVVLHRSASTGPCSLLELHWGKGRDQRMRPLRMTILLTVISILVAIVLGSFVAVRPLLRRIERLRLATQNLGQLAGYASAADPNADDLGHLSTVLDQAHARIVADAERAAKRQKALEEHLANVAHDLRTPLSSLQLTIEGLAADIKDRQNGLIRSAVDDIVYMGSLIENLYLACRLEEGADPLSGDPRVDLCVLVDNVARRFAALGRARGIEVHCARPDGEIWARCNSAMAGQVLANLVHNALAHGDAGGHVGIVLEATHETFALMVMDDGPGVAPTELPRIGERTFRSDDARQRDPAGGGLGLAIVGEVCRRANFDLKFGHEVPRGLRVTVSGKRRAA
ncbi:MAG TPA: HAMP domain-containing sensor histidine kinase [Polyangium sp.]|nr:HAMP domain-containing sensor histidine kinase [Polyangium sp.]